MSCEIYQKEFLFILVDSGNAVWNSIGIRSICKTRKHRYCLGTAAGNRVTLNWNKVKKASGYQIFLCIIKPTENTNAWKGSKNRNITSFTLTGSEDKLYTYKIRSYLKQETKLCTAIIIESTGDKNSLGKPVITRIRVREEKAEP